MKTIKYILLLLVTIITIGGSTNAGTIIVTAHDRLFTTFYEGQRYQIHEVTGGDEYIRTVVQGAIGDAGIVFQTPASNEIKCYRVSIKDPSRTGRWVISKYFSDENSGDFFFWGFDRSIDCFLPDDEETDTLRIWEFNWDERF